MAITRRESLTMLAGGLALPRSAVARVPDPCAPAPMLDMIAARLMALAPETACYNGLPEALDGGPLAHRMNDYSPKGEAQARAALSAAEADLAHIVCDSRMLAVARTVLANGSRSAGIPYGRIDVFSYTGHSPYLVTQVSGPLIDTPGVMTSQQSLNSARAVDAWLEKLDGYGNGFAGVIEKLRADEAAGCRPPRVLIERTLPVIEAFLTAPVDSHPLMIAFDNRMAAASLDQALRQRASARARTLLQRRARPAMKALRKQLRAMRLRSRDEAGVWAQPDGDALYAANVRALGDTTLPPADIHRIGREEVARISADMDHLLAARGLTQGSVSDRMAALARDPANQFPDSDAGRAALLDHVRAQVAAMQARCDEILPREMIPRQPIEVRRVPVERQAGAPGGYYDSPSPDGAQPGIYWINLRDMGAVARFRLATLSYHEGVPGHHTQSAIAQGLGELPVLLRIASFNAYQEGWALYAEQLAAEMGMYHDDPLSDLGRLQDELFRAARLVVDTGLHHERWTRERAIAEMQAITGIAESRVIAEVERYMAWPGQALGYKLGQLRLLDLRERARAAKGRRFDIKAFHAAVLGGGAMPLDLVEQAVLGG